jgi:hypothetical protein
MNVMSRRGAVILLWLASSAVAQDKPETPVAPAPVPPAGSGASAEEQPRLKVDMGRAIAEAVARILATPRFEEQVEVRDTYQEALGRYFVATDLSCGTTESGPPQADELERFRTHPVPPHADLLAGFKWLRHKLRRATMPKKPRYFLYWVHLKDSPERFVYVVREGRISENDRAVAAGTNWELLAGFAEAGQAAEAVTRLSRRVAAPSSPEHAGGVTLWAASKCRR